MKSIKLKVKHYRNAVYSNGGGPIRNASLELFPDKGAFEGVEMSLIGGTRYYYLMYGQIDFHKDLNMLKEFTSEEDVVREIKLTPA